MTSPGAAGVAPFSGQVTSGAAVPKVLVAMAPGSAAGTRSSEIAYAHPDQPDGGHGEHRALGDAPPPGAAGAQVTAADVVGRAAVGVGAAR